MTKEMPASEHELFEARLAEAKQTAQKEMFGTIKERIDLSLRRGTDKGKLLEEKIKLIYQGKTNELDAAIKRLYALRENQAIEVNKLNDSYLLDRYKMALNALQARVDLMLEIGGRGTISTPQEAIEFAEQGLFMLENIDVARLLVDKGIEASYLGISAECINPDYIMLIEKLYRNQSLSPKDLAVMGKEIKVLMTNPPRDPRHSMGAILFMHMKNNPELRNQFFESFMKDPGFDELIHTLVVSDLIDISEGEAQMQKRIEFLEKAKNKDEILKAKTSKEELSSEKTQKKKILNQGIIRNALVDIGRSVGHQNRAKKLFTLKGLVSSWAFANGAITSILGVAMNITDLPTALLGASMGGAMMGFAAQGPIGEVIGNPVNLFSRLTANKSELEDEKQKNATEEILSSFRDKKSFAEFYYRYADKILLAYRKKSTKEKSSKVKLTLDDIGIDFKDLPDEFKTLSTNKLSDQISEWVSDLVRTGDEGMARNSAESQRKFIVEAFPKDQRSGFILPTK